MTFCAACTFSSLILGFIKVHAMYLQKCQGEILILVIVIVINESCFVENQQSVVKLENT